METVAGPHPPQIPSRLKGGKKWLSSVPAGSANAELCGYGTGQQHKPISQISHFQAHSFIFGGGRNPLPTAKSRQMPPAALLVLSARPSAGKPRSPPRNGKIFILGKKKNNHLLFYTGACGEFIPFSMRLSVPLTQGNTCGHDGLPARGRVSAGHRGRVSQPFPFPSFHFPAQGKKKKPLSIYL